MPPREYPTARQARLGTELRRLRERAQKTALEAAELLATSRARISHIESGRQGVSEERIRRLATFYTCDDDSYIEALCVMSREHRGQFWWDEYRGALPTALLDMAELEYHATRIQTVEALLIPGTLQTEEYARAVFRGAIPALPPDEIDMRVEHRLRRQVIFERKNLTPFKAVIHESALRMLYGGRKVVRAQLGRLLEMGTETSVSLRVIPFDVEELPTPAQSVLYACGAVPALDTVQIDNAPGGIFLDTPPELTHYRHRIEALEGSALDETRSLNFIHHIAKEM